LNTNKKIELLAPARDAATGIEAVNHGADAVYVGAPRFSARAAAGVSTDDIARIADHAHQFHARVYVALNTILYDSELSDAERIIRDCCRAGADALIIQDMGILRLDIPPIELHASTQCDNSDAAHIRFLEQAGFSQVVLARELSPGDIAEIAAQTSIRLEAFVHGSLCVSLSGRCYISQAATGRSANRGECAQFCRLPWLLQDANGCTIVRERHLLSLPDLNRSAHLEAMLDAGVSSFKIEGRLKDAGYVKNITAFYRRRLDEIIDRRPEFLRASSGRVETTFVPDPARSFNRGFTDYFPSIAPPVAGMDSPKSTGEPLGEVRDVNARWFTLSGRKQLHNGDGLCFFRQGELVGFRVNRVENGRIFPADMPSLRPGMLIFRNFDHEFEKTLAAESAERKIDVEMLFEENAFGYSLTALDADGCRATATVATTKEPALKPQDENIRRQLSKLGATPFALKSLNINLSGNLFITASTLNDLRRRTIDLLLSARKINFDQPLRRPTQHNPIFPETSLDCTANVSNAAARRFYADCGVKNIRPAFEIEPATDVPLMTTHLCVLRSTGRCRAEKDSLQDFTEPLFLVAGRNRFRLEFDCRRCEMKIFQKS